MGKQIFIVSQDKTLCHEFRAVFSDEYINLCFLGSITELEYDFCGLIIVDMPEFEMSLLEGIRTTAKPIPVLVLHMRLSVQEKLLLYHTGAAALLERAAAMEICAAQVQALIRLQTEKDISHKQYPLTFGAELMIDPSCRIVKVDEKILDLTRKEFDCFILQKIRIGC